MARFATSNCKPISTPLAKNEKLQHNDGAPKEDAKNYSSLAGSLIYLTSTRSYIALLISFISRFMQEPSRLHYAAAEIILRYLQVRGNMAVAS
ncbi:hypothetical protein SADUNF_Sadunf08G0131500 [Salix dunnii]|uniref:Uncharacterized protein n=1 Tax=Salix dunnii TaxID=1413687 RepID=A0A835K2X8_9ROSI|nr:hypothetical protein SADUNF_Sadunf08G0131500 [Salix dunnii]